jgi:NADH-quinone oxidoreductase subunit L
MLVLCLIVVLAPLGASLIAGLLGRVIGRVGAHSVTIFGLALSFVLSMIVVYMLINGAEPLNQTLYHWMVSDGVTIQIGFLIDHLTALMMAVVTFVSLAVHLYTVGYMHDDPGYQRFFSYISLFTFAMLMLVMSNNFLQLFFGWEGVGLVSYLLIGFWFTRPSATFASLKAFLVNRVGDIGFLLGIGMIEAHTGSLDYTTVFAHASQLASAHIQIFPGHQWMLITVICILLMIGAMAKSAQMPLHVWLPDSMEGPTPISALIHAATMVTAGIFMIARMAPLYEHSDTALTVILFIGSLTAFFMGLLGIVQMDIKRVIAYSTISQLGYMFAALGASAYAAGIFHLMTHAFFKALLFLGAGSVIVSMHHEQDMSKLGGLRRYMPITYWTTLIGALALIAFPGFSGFFSKDTIIEAVGMSQLPGGGLAYVLLTLSVYVTALYTFRMFFLTFHGEPRMDVHTREHLKESPWVMTVPLIALAIPSVLVGAFVIKPLVYGPWLAGALPVSARHDVLASLAHDYHGWLPSIVEAFRTWPIYLAILGVFTAWFFYMYKPELPGRLKARFSLVYRMLWNKYGFDDLYIAGFARLGRGVGTALWRAGDETMIDGVAVNGTANTVGRAAGFFRNVQTGYLYHYAFVMIIGLCVLLGWFVFLR